MCLRCNSSTGGHHSTLVCTTPQSTDVYIHKNGANTVRWNLRAVMRWVRELAAPGCHWSAKESADQYYVLNVETDTAGPAPAMAFSPTPASNLDIDGNSSLVDQVWAAGRDLDVDAFQMPTMSQLSAGFVFGTLYGDA